jgi:hypothetical protein
MPILVFLTGHQTREFLWLQNDLNKWFMLFLVFKKNYISVEVQEPKNVESSF